MRRYETIFIIDPDLSEEQRAPLFERLKEIISRFNGMLVVFDQWGAKRLAYEIKKRARGFYVRLDFCGTGTLVNEIERFFQIDDRVLKYMTVVLERDVDLERIKADLAEPESEAESEVDPSAKEQEEVAVEAEPSDESLAQETPSEDLEVQESPNEGTDLESKKEE
jgi:small subunit ribosomal protein S6